LHETFINTFLIARLLLLLLMLDVVAIMSGQLNINEVISIKLELRLSKIMMILLSLLFA